MRKLRITRYNEALAEVKGVWKLGENKDAFDRIEASKRLVESGLELYDQQQNRIAYLAEYVEFAKKVEEMTKAVFDEGRLFGAAEMHYARYARFDAEIQLLKASRAAEIHRPDRRRSG